MNNATETQRHQHYSEIFKSQLSGYEPFRKMSLVTALRKVGLSEKLKSAFKPDVNQVLHTVGNWMYLVKINHTSTYSLMINEA